MKLSSIGLSLILIAGPVAAHDFWLEPRQFQGAAAAPFAMTFQIGHGAARQRYGASDRIVVIQEFSIGQRRDLRAAVRSTGPIDLLTNFATPGVHVIGMQTNYAFSDLPAIRFNNYAKAEGLIPILAERRRAGTEDKAGRERYSRRAKTLVQIGPQTAANQASATLPIGLKLEIVPERNPYNLGATRLLPVRVLYNGRRLANATIKLTNLDADEKPFATVITDHAGRARFRVPATGRWLLNVLWSEPLRGVADADFDTTFSSLTFGYDTGTRLR